MFQMQYFVPDGYPRIDVPLDNETTELTRKLKGVDKKSVPIPNSALSVQLFLMLNGASLEIKKRDQLAFINFFCFEAMNSPEVFILVEDFYKKYNLGVPKPPKLPCWIHSIPIAYDRLRENEVTLCTKVTVSFFWATFYQKLKKSNPMN